MDEALNAFFVIVSNGGDGVEAFVGILSLFVSGYILVFLIDPVVE